MNHLVFIVQGGGGISRHPPRPCVKACGIPFRRGVQGDDARSAPCIFASLG
ncbi:hypothetical protein [Methanofollis tationis]|uniref:Uncharacterized protein n=1 Tax=Methanofollis tationis TaxID=81417 RepID=A0A7K4HMF8_9EURY|nr:hypothetical protein [Methanofollis tationis]NVO66247.1 hypothetical protein [Methanofollis tationis]